MHSQPIVALIFTHVLSPQEYKCYAISPEVFGIILIITANFKTGQTGYNLNLTPD
jgi:hypothetical protein